MKQHLNTLVRDADAFCSRLNDGLAAVAILLGFLVAMMAVIRGQEIMSDVSTSMPTVYQAAMAE